MKRILPMILAVALLCAGCQRERTDPGNHLAVDPDWENRVEYDGVEYRRRTDVRTILFLGIDDTQTVEAEGIEIGNRGRADSITLFILDKTAKTTQVLTVSRNTMTEVDVYKGNGDFAYSGVMHLNMQYAFGDSPTRCNFLMKRTVSELLYDTKIDGCLSLTMEGISVIVDEMGGITLTMPEDYTDIDPAYTAGATVTLDGAAAERFVRHRDIYTVGSAEERLDRHGWLIHTMFQQMKGRGDMEELLERLPEAAEDYIESDVDAETLKMLSDYTLLDETLKVPGTNVMGEFRSEYYVDEEALKALILELYYDPAT